MNSKLLKYAIIIVIIGVLAAAAMYFYVFHKPKRDVANEKAEFSISASELYKDYVKDQKAANLKYLSAANGKVLEIAGIVAEVTKGQGGAITVSLKDESIGDGAIS